MLKLSRDFFSKPTVSVAQALLGQGFYCHGVQGIITETEAYVGEDDPASHAARGKTARSAVMYEHPGTLYVYLIYGMYHCLNVVTERQDYPAAVLIRGLYLPEQQLHLDGPGKLCRALSITKAFNYLDSVKSKDCFFFQNEIKDLQYIETPRIGIKKGLDKLWRFVYQVDI